MSEELERVTANDEDQTSLAAWFDTWGRYVAQCEFSLARELFSTDVVGFGTYMDTVKGLDELEAKQWRNIWPTISGFRFLTDNLTTFVSSDRCLATVMVMWASTGYSQSGEPYPRPGRTTAVLTRISPDHPWLGLHTHFSEFPAETQRSFGSR